MTGAPHRHFHDELSQLKDRLLHMSGEVEAAVDRAVRALLEHDADAAEQIIAHDSAIDELEIEIENGVTNLLALQQPMARDLRLLLAALKISNDLERMGDHAVNIAQSAKRLRDAPPITPAPELSDMARSVKAMLSGVLSAFVKGDSAAARAICRQDDHVDALHRSMFRILLTHMAEVPSTITAAMELLLVSRNLERVADLATNIGEDVVFMVEGTTIKHHAETGGVAGGR
jgi:phosphate transport system protein